MADERLVDFWTRAIADQSPALLQQLRGVALSLIAARRALRVHMPDEFVHCPSLDLLYALFVADHHTLTEEAMMVACPVSPAVARRWIDVFAQRDLVVRHRDTMRVELTETGFRMMAHSCQAVIESQMTARVTRVN